MNGLVAVSDIDISVDNDDKSLPSDDGDLKMQVVWSTKSHGSCRTRFAHAFLLISSMLGLA